MNAMRRNLRFATIYGTVSMLLMLTLSACYTLTQTPSAPPVEGLLLATPAQAGVPCVECAQATLAAALTQEKVNADVQAVATAEIVRADAQATINSANATLSAVQTQQQNSTDIIAAQIAATAAIAQATLNSAGLTQIAAMTQSQYNLQVTQAAGTQIAVAMITQQYKNDLAANTQTAIANNVATQTQSAVATSQWYTDQTRQRDEQRKELITSLWMWSLPLFIVLLTGLVLWVFWRWLKIQQDNQRILENPVDRLQAQVAHHHHQDDSLPYLESDFVDGRYQLTKPDDNVDEWLDEVKSKLLDNDEEEE